MTSPFARAAEAAQWFGDAVSAMYGGRVRKMEQSSRRFKRQPIGGLPDRPRLAQRDAARDRPARNG